MDTNILVRVAVEDDPEQSRIARGLLTRADSVAVPITALCEMVWVLSRSYKISSVDIAATIRALTRAECVRTDQPALAAGLALLDMGGDFADGAIAYEGRCLGGKTFVSFDQAAVKRLNAVGIAAVEAA